MSKALRVWSNLYRLILVVCVLGFLCGAGLLHGPVAFLVVALVLTVTLGFLWLGAVVLCLVEFKELGLHRLMVALLLPPSAVGGTQMMTDRYPDWISTVYFHNHVDQYREAVELARADSSNSGVYKLPERLRKLSIDGDVSVHTGPDGQFWYGFYVGHGFMSPGPVIQFSSDVSIGGGAKELAPGWSLSPQGSGWVLLEKAD